MKKVHLLIGMAVGTVLCVIVVGVLIYQRNQTTDDDIDESVRDLVELEETLQDLTPLVQKLSKSINNVALPDTFTRDLFSESVLVRDLDPNGQITETASYEPISVRETRWPISAQQEKLSGDDLKMWSSLLEDIAYFQHAKFYVIDGDELFLDTEERKLETRMGFQALARLRDETWRGIAIEQVVLWDVDSPAPEDWKIEKWDLKSVNAIEAEQLLFEDVTASMFRQADDKLAMETSVHETEIVNILSRRPKSDLIPKKHSDFFRPDAVAKHPGISVVDVDQNGFDDIFVMPRWSPNQLLMNYGDGTFEDKAAEYGLDFSGLCNSATFADFDNDGDVDLFLGRSLEPSVYLENQNGQFVDQSSKIDIAKMPAFVTSTSAVDYNQDGLLDLYICTYALTDRDVNDKLAKRLLTPEQSVFLDASRNGTDSERYLESPGPPNVLLKNVGNGSFEVAPENSQLELWMNSFQSVWADFDGDHDVDVYISNDFAPDFFFRNDGDKGFTDITEEVGGQDMMGFGMGASFGDFDNDQLQDLYVSNMFSKAGIRITQRFENLDSRMAKSAEGNRLFKNIGGDFDLVSRKGEPMAIVAKADWSWSGQFVDIDNDGFLDIAVSSGYYTAPKPVATGLDL